MQNKEETELEQKIRLLERRVELLENAIGVFLDFFKSLYDWASDIKPATLEKKETIV